MNPSTAASMLRKYGTDSATLLTLPRLFLRAHLEYGLTMNPHGPANAIPCVVQRPRSTLGTLLTLESFPSSLPSGNAGAASRLTEYAPAKRAAAVRRNETPAC